jgi:hypothetical protein
MTQGQDPTAMATASWSTWKQALAVVCAPRSLKRSGTIALIVGSVFFAMNQLHLIVAGDATALVWVKTALTYLTPLVVSNVGLLTATQATRLPAHAQEELR